MTMSLSHGTTLTTMMSQKNPKKLPSTTTKIRVASSVEWSGRAGTSAKPRVTLASNPNPNPNPLPSHVPPWPAIHTL